MSADPMDVDEQEIDENLYSRQLYVIDHASMKRVMGSNVLLLGLGGLGVEIAKNVILTGVKSLTIWDPVPASQLDLASQFYLTEGDVAAGTSRAEASRSKLEELNPYVDVTLHTGKLTDDFLARFQVVVATDTSLEDQLHINGVCRANGAKFIAADVRGVSSSVFCDFGSEFVVHDKNGEALRSYMISSITKESPGAITLIEDARCDLETGDYVVFKDVEGMVELNNQKPMQVTVKGPYALEVADTTKFSAYSKGGVLQEVKMPVTVEFLPLQAAIGEPEFFLTDFAKFEKPGQLHVAFMALHEFRKRNGRLPRSHSTDDSDQLLTLAKEFNAKHNTVEEIDAAVIRQVSFTAQATISPMAAFAGGVVGQEVLKACTGKFTPIKQWMYFDAVEMLPEEEDPALFQPQGSRYDSQTIVFGKDVQQKVLNLSYFLVGAGAIGCELLKNWACMGVGAESGMIHVTDMDTIEKSNLNRQFLFRPNDVSRLKSETAAAAVVKMNPGLNIKPYALRVGAETESIFNNEFYGSLSGVCNALDNVEARMYMDSQCINHRLSLLESGTLGTKGNTQVIVPDLTESYASSRDPPEKTIPMCTLHHFPNRIEHTIQWARDSFEGIFASTAENVNAYLSQANFLDALQKQSLVSRLEIVKSIHSSLVTDRPLTFAECITWARLRFEEYFNNNIQQLLFNFPKDLVTSSGAPFWSGPKKAPSPLEFDASNDEHMSFIVAAANLRAFNYGLNGSRDPAAFQKVLPTVQISPFKPKTNVAIPASDAEAAKAKENGGASSSLDADENELKEVLEQLPQPDTLVGYRMEPADFEKDVDENFHIDFITACSNLRACNYSIPPADKHKTKGIAGKIIPAMVTTTAMITGLVCIEMMKLVQKKKLEEYKNGFANLAIPFVAFSEPQAPERVTVRDGWSWSLWDRFDVKGPKTLQQILDYFQEEHQLEVTMASAGMTLVYAFFHKKDTLKTRLAMELTELVESVSKKPVDKSAGIQLTVCCSREEDGEDVEVPWVSYTLE